MIVIIILIVLFVGALLYMELRVRKITSDCGLARLKAHFWEFEFSFAVKDSGERSCAMDRLNSFLDQMSRKDYYDLGHASPGQEVTEYLRLNLVRGFREKENRMRSGVRKALTDLLRARVQRQ